MKASAIVARHFFRELLVADRAIDDQQRTCDRYAALGSERAMVRAACKLMALQRRRRKLERAFREADLERAFEERREAERASRMQLAEAS